MGVLRDWHAVFGTCSNITVLLGTLVSFDVESLDQDKVPFLHYAARKLAIAISSRNYDTFQSSQSNPAKFNYYVFGVIDRFMNAIARTLQDESAIVAAMPANGNSLESSISTVNF